MKIHSVGVELFHGDGRTDRQTDRQDEASSRFSRFCESGQHGCTEQSRSTIHRRTVATSRCPTVVPLMMAQLGRNFWDMF